MNHGIFVIGPMESWVKWWIISGWIQNFSHLPFGDFQCVSCTLLIQIPFASSTGALFSVPDEEEERKHLSEWSNQKHNHLYRSRATERNSRPTCSKDGCWVHIEPTETVLTDSMNSLSSLTSALASTKAFCFSSLFAVRSLTVSWSLCTIDSKEKIQLSPST